MDPIRSMMGAGGANDAGSAERGNQLMDMMKDLVPKLLEGGADILKTVMPQLAPLIEIAEKVMQGLGASAEEFSQASKALEDPGTVDQMNKAMG
jgi:hypothetical protein